MYGRHVNTLDVSEINMLVQEDPSKDIVNQLIAFSDKYTTTQQIPTIEHITDTYLDSESFDSIDIPLLMAMNNINNVELFISYAVKFNQLNNLPNSNLNEAWIKLDSNHLYYQDPNNYENYSCNIIDISIPCVIDNRNTNIFIGNRYGNYVPLSLFNNHNTGECIKFAMPALYANSDDVVTVRHFREYDKLTAYDKFLFNDAAIIVTAIISQFNHNDYNYCINDIIKEIEEIHGSTLEPVIRDGEPKKPSHKHISSHESSNDISYDPFPDVAEYTKNKYNIFTMSPNKIFTTNPIDSPYNIKREFDIRCKNNHWINPNGFIIANDKLLTSDAFENYIKLLYDMNVNKYMGNSFSIISFIELDESNLKSVPICINGNTYMANISDFYNYIPTGMIEKRNSRDEFSIVIPATYTDENNEVHDVGIYTVLRVVA